MVALRLVRLLEKHSDEIGNTLLSKLRTSSRTKGMKAISEAELSTGIRSFVQHLSEWLLTKTNAEIEIRSRTFGGRLARQQVALVDACWSLIIIKEFLWDFLQREGFLRSPIEVYGELELLCLLSQFFDRTVGYLVEGYENEKCREARGSLHYAGATRT